MPYHQISVFVITVVRLLFVDLSVIFAVAQTSHGQTVYLSYPNFEILDGF